MTALDIGLRASIVVLVALAASAALRRRSAALRHWVLAAGILSARGGRAARHRAAGVGPAAASTATEAPVTRLAGQQPPAPVAGRPAPARTVTRAGAGHAACSIDAIVNAVWAAGFVVSLLVMLVSLRRLVAADGATPGR